MVSKTAMPVINNNNATNAALCGEAKPKAGPAVFDVVATSALSSSPAPPLPPPSRAPVALTTDAPPAAAPSSDEADDVMLLAAMAQASELAEERKALDAQAQLLVELVRRDDDAAAQTMQGLLCFNHRPTERALNKYVAASKAKKKDGKDFPAVAKRFNDRVFNAKDGALLPVVTLRALLCPDPLSGAVLLDARDVVRAFQDDSSAMAMYMFAWRVRRALRDAMAERGFDPATALVACAPPPAWARQLACYQPAAAAAAAATQADAPTSSAEEDVVAEPEEGVPAAPPAPAQEAAAGPALAPATVVRVEAGDACVTASSFTPGAPVLPFAAVLQSMKLSCELMTAAAKAQLAVKPAPALPPSTAAAAATVEAARALAIVPWVPHTPHTLRGAPRQALPDLRRLLAPTPTLLPPAVPSNPTTTALIVYSPPAWARRALAAAAPTLRPALTQPRLPTPANRVLMLAQELALQTALASPKLTLALPAPLEVEEEPAAAAPEAEAEPTPSRTPIPAGRGTAIWGQGAVVAVMADGAGGDHELAVFAPMAVAEYKPQPAAVVEDESDKEEEGEEEEEENEEAEPAVVPPAAKPGATSAVLVVAPKSAQPTRTWADVVRCVKDKNEGAEPAVVPPAAKTGATPAAKAGATPAVSLVAPEPAQPTRTWADVVRCGIARA